jgi:4-amino-4-deoxy-L-arabinose transferase-like glycosyltransferase
MAIIVEDTRRFVRSGVGAASARFAWAPEAVAVLAAPAILYAALRLRGMAPPQTADPGIHTGFIFDPHAMFVRYEALLAPTGRFREAARVGFLVPARVTYLLFGAVPGFYVLRYLLALVAIVPVYLLLKRLYGRWAGFVGIAVVMSSPVVITAWGTNYPDAAVVSYLTGGLAALALSLESRRRAPRWLLLAAGLFTMAVWSHGVSVPLVLAALVAYLGLRLARNRTYLVRHLALIAASGVVVTLLLGLASAVFIGQFDFITPTVQSASALSKASEIRLWHSTSWRWVLYDNYLLVPPAIIAAFAVVFAHAPRRIGTSQLLVGLTGVLQLAILVYLQFFGNQWVLQSHWFSSTLWSSVNIMLAMVVAEMARPMLRVRRLERPSGSAGEPWSPRKVRAARWVAAGLPALVVLGVALAYEAAPRVPAMTWPRWGVVLAALVVAAAVVGRLLIVWSQASGRQRSIVSLAVGGLLSVGAVVMVTGAALVLTVAPPKPHLLPPDTVAAPIPAYSTALGGSDAIYVDRYRVDSKLLRFVGPPTYRGEVLFTWEPPTDFGNLLGALGMFHNSYTWVSRKFPVLDAGGALKIKNRRAAQVLLLSLTGAHFPQAVHSLARLQPVVVRRTILSAGSYRLHAWLINLQSSLVERRKRR